MNSSAMPGEGESPDLMEDGDLTRGSDVYDTIAPTLGVQR